MLLETLILVKEEKTIIKIKKVVEYIIYLALWLGTLYISICKKEYIWFVFVFLFGVPGVFLYLAKNQILNANK